MNSIKSQNGIDTIFTNSDNSKTFDPRRLLLNLLDKINLKIYYFIKSQRLLYMEKYKKAIQK